MKYVAHAHSYQVFTEQAEIVLQSKRTLKYQQRTEWTVPYRTKLCRTKVTKLFRGDEKFCPTKNLSDKVFSGKVVRKLGQIQIF